MNIIKMNLNQLENLHRQLREQEYREIATVKHGGEKELVYTRQFRHHVEIMIKERRKQNKYLK